jgi:hypothetical protein
LSTRKVRASYIGRVEDVAQLVAGEAIGAGVPSVELSAEIRAAVLVPGKRFSFVAEIVGEWRHRMAGIYRSSAKTSMKRVPLNFKEYCPMTGATQLNAVGGAIFD